MQKPDFLTQFDIVSSQNWKVFDYYSDKNASTDPEENNRVASSNRDAFIGICNLNAPQQAIAKAYIEAGSRHNVAFAIAKSATLVEGSLSGNQNPASYRRLPNQGVADLSF